jgi:hypothetical protein
MSCSLPLERSWLDEVGTGAHAARPPGFGTWWCQDHEGPPSTGPAARQKCYFCIVVGIGRLIGNGVVDRHRFSTQRARSQVSVIGPASSID